MIYNDPRFQIYFGDARDKLHPSFYVPLRQKLNKRQEFTHVFKQLTLADLLFQHQTHSTKGAVITKQSFASMIPFAQEGDFLVTDQPNIGLGVMTADCVPVVCVDSKRAAVGIAHAGWRGAVAGIVENMIAAMQREYGSQIVDLQFFIGPSAKSCCYQVSSDFLDNLARYSYRDQLFRYADNNIYFDVSLFIYRQLLALGASSAAINMSYNLCTMCHARFYSHRRGTIAGNAGLVGRQMTVVALR